MYVCMYACMHDVFKARHGAFYKRPRMEDCEFEISLGHTEENVSNKNKNRLQIQMFAFCIYIWQMAGT